MSIDLLWLRSVTSSFCHLTSNTITAGGMWGFSSASLVRSLLCVIRVHISDYTFILVFNFVATISKFRAISDQMVVLTRPFSCLTLSSLCPALDDRLMYHVLYLFNVV
jgi:hypothetical protein